MGMSVSWDNNDYKLTKNNKNIVTRTMSYFRGIQVWYVIISKDIDIPHVLRYHNLCLFNANSTVTLPQSNK